jgi:hypothetical protein
MHACCLLLGPGYIVHRLLAGTAKCRTAGRHCQVPYRWQALPSAVPGMWAGLQMPGARVYAMHKLEKNPASSPSILHVPVQLLPQPH